MDVWPEHVHAHASIGQEDSGILHLFDVRRDGSKFAGRLAQAVFVGRDAPFGDGLVHRMPDVLVLVQSVVHLFLLLKLAECQGTLVQLLLLVSQHFVVVRQLIADVGIEVLLLARLPLQEVVEVGLRGVRVHFLAVVVEVSEGLVGVLRLGRNRLSVAGAVSEVGDRVAEQGRLLGRIAEMGSVLCLNEALVVRTHGLVEA